MKHFFTILFIMAGHILFSQKNVNQAFKEVCDCFETRFNEEYEHLNLNRADSCFIEAVNNLTQKQQDNRLDNRLKIKLIRKCDIFYAITETKRLREFFLKSPTQLDQEIKLLSTYIAITPMQNFS
ncbi:hypothetical protein LVD17_08960 [Fulvivirga ulvae]|uniref:hypothetical protein n=1 Tax=Fulvivirga ulvae TaxID=2904245 RepID=UPI001F29D5B7|nr:hypothetical protein [Fulvivirga ulvae]UII33943.1 hypothetical protein LVD17_08960 [Fulvivirga ulvae]